MQLVCILLPYISAEYLQKILSLKVGSVFLRHSVLDCSVFLMLGQFTYCSLCAYTVMHVQLGIA